MKRMAGVLHHCVKDGDKKYLNPIKFPTCPSCGEDMTNKPIKMYDVETTNIHPINALEPKAMIHMADFFLKMAHFQAKYDHPKLAVDCITTSKTLLYWAKVGLEGGKPMSVKVIKD